MKVFLVLLLVYILINAGLIALGIGLGSLLHWMLPSVDRGTSILIAVVVTGFSIHFFVRLLWFSEYFEVQESGEDELPAVQIYPVRTPRSGRKRKRKET